MSILGHVRFPPAAIAALPAPTPQDRFSAFLRSGDESVFLVEMTGRAINDNNDQTLQMPVVGAHHVAWIKQPAILAGLEQRLMFSSRIWIGRPDDPAAPNRPAMARLASPLRITRSIPVSPDESRRSQSSVATIELRNKDRRHDSFIRDFRLRGGEVEVRYGPRRGYYLDTSRIALARARASEGFSDTLRIELEEVRDVLATPLQGARYDGKGGLGGDFDLAGQLKPFTVGDVWNMEPVRISKLEPIYQAHSAEIFGIPAVYERMVPFADSGIDVDTYQELLALSVPDGQYATCLKFGLFKLGAEPVGRITCWVFGATFGGGEKTAAGEIMLAAAQTRLAVNPSRINTPSFFDQIFQAPVGWTSQQRDVTGLQFFEELLAVFNGHVALDQNGRLTIAAVLAPELRPISRVIRVSGERVRPQIYNAVVTPVQRIRYRKNWTRMGAEDISEFADAELAAAAQSDGPVAERTSPTAFTAYGAVDYGETTDSPLRDVEDAAAVALQREQIAGRDRNIVQVRDLDRSYFDLDLGRYVRLEFTGEDRFGLAGLHFCVREVDLDGRAETVSLELYG